MDKLKNVVHSKAQLSAAAAHSDGLGSGCSALKEPRDTVVTMAANKTVIVLAPNGRRQSVKVTLDTTILQILEEVCRKQGYNVDDYDIKHIHRILDPNMIFRFASLPNNAQLEMVNCIKARTATNVTIGIQPENGERIMREFSPNTTLAQALMDIYPNSDLKRSVLIYMHREVCGKDALENTTLKSLGLNSGRAILRLIYRDLGQLRTQAHVSTPLLPKSVTAVNNFSIDKNNQNVPSQHCSKTTGDTILLKNDMPNIKNKKKSDDEEKIGIEKHERKIVKEDIIDKEINRSKNKETDSSTISKTLSTTSSQKDHNIKKDLNISKACARIHDDTYNIVFLGERNALIFNQAGTEAVPKDELPDSFFDLDLYDAKTLLRDAKRRREQLENTPLLTETQRQLDRDKRTLDQLNKYRRIVIRVQFPDQFVLQGLFGPLESVQTIKNFIKKYLDNPDCDFTIYTTPPKHILNPEARLIDENLIPSAIVHYSGESSLKSSVKMKLTHPKAANIEAAKSRIGTMQSEEQDSVATDDRNLVAESKGDHVTPGPSNNELLASSSLSSTSPSAPNQNRLPKWFKQAFK